MSRSVDDAKAARKAASKKHKDTSARMSSLIASEENRLQQLSENRMENARLSREVQRLETALGRKQARSPQRA